MKRTLTALTTALALSACATVPDAPSRGTLPSGPPIVIHNDEGGDVIKYSQAVMAREASGRRVEISGYCHSACLMNLGSPNVCIRPGTIFRTHTTVRPDGTVVEQTAGAAHRTLIAFHMPPALGEWYLTLRAGPTIYHASTERMVEYGARICDD